MFDLLQYIFFLPFAQFVIRSIQDSPVWECHFSHQLGGHKRQQPRGWNTFSIVFFCVAAFPLSISACRCTLVLITTSREQTRLYSSPA